MRHFLSVIFIVFAGWATAQSYPEPSDLAVNDFAGIIGEEAEARLTEKLDALRKDTDVEMVVVTLSRQEMFAPDMSLKKFARGIFDEWGIGDKKRDDGVLVLVLRGDQAMRIALGKGFGNKADKASDKAVERSFLPEFREDRYEQGIENGVTDLIENLVKPYVKKRDKDVGEDVAAADTTEVDAGASEEANSDTASTEAASTEAADTEASSASSGDAAPASETKEGGGGLSWLLYIAGGIAALIAFLKLKAGMRKCPECGQKGLKVESSTIQEATEEAAGKGEKVTSCAKCGYKDVEPYEIAKREKPEEKPAKPEEPENFSGGKAGKEGSTGKW